MEANGHLPAPSPKSSVSSELPIAVDVMGADHGLGVQVEGAIQAFNEFGARSILVGIEEDIRAKLAGFGASSLPISVCHAPEVIAMDDTPAKAVRRKPDASLCVAYNLVQSGQASAVLSSGNSGAMMAAGRILCGLLPGIERPAIATLLPVVGDGKPNVILDSGANVDCHAQNLVQFAIMGAVYCNSLFHTDRPRVALLSNGTEPSKGTDLLRAASMILSRSDAINFVGYVEGRDVATNYADVIVCDGFVGNVLLKAMEGCVRLIFDQLIHESRKGLLRKLGLAMSRQVYKEVFSEKFDYTAHGGAPLLGLQKLAIVLHGSSGARAVKNAIRVADSFVRDRMLDKIAQQLSHLEEQIPEFEGEILSGVFSKNNEVLSLGKRRMIDGGDALVLERQASSGSHQTIPAPATPAIGNVANGNTAGTVALPNADSVAEISEE